MKEAIDLDEKQLQCMSSSVRTEILKHIQHQGPCSIKEVAALLGRSHADLFYHFRELAICGLLDIVEWRKAGKRTEAVYAAAARKYIYELSGKPPSFLEKAAKSVGGMLRLADREFAAAAKAAPHEPSVLAGMKAMRTSARLSNEDSETLKRKIEEIVDWMRERDKADSGPRVAFTGLVTPMLAGKPKIVER